MILQALASYYETLVAKGEIEGDGWGTVKTSFAIELNENGEMLSLMPLLSPVTDAKGKTVEKPREFKNAPMPVKRSSGVSSNFLFENAQYFFGINEEKPKRGRECFEAAKELHIRLLADCDSDFAHAICNFFSVWNPDAAATHPLLVGAMKELSAGANITFFYNGDFACNDPAIRCAWQTEYRARGQSGEATYIDLVTGERVAPCLVHPAIKGVRDAQSSGAAIVSFNAVGFESYGRVKAQGENSPVGQDTAFAYTTALNRLLADRNHRKFWGDSTVVYWSEDAEDGYSAFFGLTMDGGESDTLSDEKLDDTMGALASGRTADFGGIPLHPDNKFYILALSPNAARISVRFFYQSSFGDLISNIRRHYEDMKIVGCERPLSLFSVLTETVRKGGTTLPPPLPQLSGDMLRAILTGGRYPETLFQQIERRIHAEHRLEGKKAAVIKAYLLRNANINKEVLTMKLNEESTYLPYVLGQVFSVLSTVQERASNVSTIRDRYFSSTASTPALVFPRLIDLARKHLRKLEGGARVYWEKQLGELLALVGETYPTQLTLQEQGVFQLGFYHREQKKYEKKESAEEAN